MSKRSTQTPGVYKQQSLVSGMTVNVIMAMDPEQFNKLNRSEMAKVTGRLVSAANKSMRRLEQAGIQTQAYNKVMSSGGYFSVKGKSLNELRSEFLRARNYLESKTASVSGYKKVIKQTQQTLEQKKGIKVPTEKIEDFWKVYERLKQVDPSVSVATLKYSVLKEVSSAMEEDTDKDVDDIVADISDKLSDIYEKNTETAEDDWIDGGISPFFE